MCYPTVLVTYFVLCDILIGCTTHGEYGEMRSVEETDVASAREQRQTRRYQ